jgi:hypothetical protein
MPSLLRLCSGSAPGLLRLFLRKPLISRARSAAPAFFRVSGGEGVSIGFHTFLNSKFQNSENQNQNDEIRIFSISKIEDQNSFRWGRQELPDFPGLSIENRQSIGHQPITRDKLVRSFRVLARLCHGFVRA